jgi:hypothetical protein
MPRWWLALLGKTAKSITDKGHKNEYRPEPSSWALVLGVVQAATVGRRSWVQIWKTGVNAMRRCAPEYSLNFCILNIALGVGNETRCFRTLTAKVPQNVEFIYHCPTMGSHAQEELIEVNSRPPSTQSRRSAMSPCGRCVQSHPPRLHMPFCRTRYIGRLS